MTPAQLAEHRRWKEERERVDAERLKRLSAVNQEGKQEWKREWDGSAHKQHR